MTDTRTALEEAWLAIHHEGYPPENERDTCRKCDRFRRFLDAEAWTSAAEMLVPEGANFVVMRAVDGLIYASVGFERPCQNDVPAIALAAACLKAKEAGDGR